MADYSVEIAALEQVLNSGTSHVSVDGMQTTFDLEQIRKRLAELKALDDASQSAGNVRPALSSIKLRFNQ